VRDVGEIGENVLAQWAAQVGITANRVRRDRTGWDFLLELPLSHQGRSGNLPLDRQKKPAQCLIQLKSSDHPRGRVSIKLDNCFRLVQSPLAAFVLVLEFGGSNDCEGAFLVHFDESQIHRILRRIREVGVESAGKPLHQSTLSFRYSDAHQLSTIDGNGLLSRLKEEIGDPDTYATRKEALLRTVGYETGGQFINATVHFALRDEADDPHDLLVDWSLGLVESLDIAAGAKLFDDRFGILHPTPIRTFPSEGRIKSQPSGKGLLRLRTLDGKSERLMPAVLFGSKAVDGFVPDEKHKIRIAAPFLDVLIPISKLDIWTCRIRIPDPDTALPLTELRSLSDMLLLFGDAATAGGLEVEVSVDEHSFSGTLLSDWDIGSNRLELATAIRAAAQISKYFGIPKDMSTTINQLYRERSALGLIDAALRGETLAAHIEFHSESLLPSDMKVCFPFQIDTRLGHRIVVIAAAYIGTPNPTGAIIDGNHEYHLQDLSIKVVESVATEPGLVPERSRIDMLENVVQKCDGFEVIRWWESTE
jgi:hypothetical protein